MLKIRVEYDRDTSPAKLTDISAKFHYSSLIIVSAGICQRALVDDSRMIRTQMRTHSRSENGRPQCMGRFVRYHTVTVTSDAVNAQVYRR
jgi:hypothetical protein